MGVQSRRRGYRCVTSESEIREHDYYYFDSPKMSVNCVCIISIL